MIEIVMDLVKSCSFKHYALVLYGCLCDSDFFPFSDGNLCNLYYYGIILCLMLTRVLCRFAQIFLFLSHIYHFDTFLCRELHPLYAVASVSGARFRRILHILFGMLVLMAYHSNLIHRYSCICANPF